MGSLGTQEMIVIFVMALLIFGPKKLPELGRTVAKAMGEFRRASAELKGTFDREMNSLERETESLRQATSDLHNEVRDHTYNHDDSNYYDSSYYSGESTDSTHTSTTTLSASATQGAETPAIEASEHTLALADPSHETSHEPSGHAAVTPVPAADTVAQTDGHAKPVHS